MLWHVVGSEQFLKFWCDYVLNWDALNVSSAVLILFLIYYNNCGFKLKKSFDILRNQKLS